MNHLFLALEIPQNIQRLSHPLINLPKQNVAWFSMQYFQKPRLNILVHVLVRKLYFPNMYPLHSSQIHDLIIMPLPKPTKYGMIIWAHLSTTQVLFQINPEIFLMHSHHLGWPKSHVNPSHGILSTSPHILSKSHLTLYSEGIKYHPVKILPTFGRHANISFV